MTRRRSNSRWRARGLALMMGVVMALGSCTTNRTLLIHGDSSATVLDGRIPIASYVTADGVRHKFQGFAQAHGESLWFVIPARDRSLERVIQEQVVIASRDSIRSIDRKLTDYPRTIVAAAFLGAIFGTFAILTFSHPSVRVLDW